MVGWTAVDAVDLAIIVACAVAGVGVAFWAIVGRRRSEHGIDPMLLGSAIVVVILALSIVFFR